MNQEERLLARIMFVNRLLKANNQSFQQLFWAVMRKKHGTDFVEIRPQGRLGDGGNDGYLPALGHYFQVYGPIDPAEKVTEAADKLADDFEKLKTSWNQHTGIQSYSFVFNDKYEGTFLRIGQALADLEKAHSSVRCRPFTASDLEDTFIALPDDDIFGILGSLVPDPTRVTHVDYGALREVIAHIMTAPASAAPTRFGELPDLGDKIQLNKLCCAHADIIRRGARQSGHVDNYFSKNSNFMKQSLRDHLVERYREARDRVRSYPAVPANLNREDLVFSDFRSALLPGGATVAAEAAVDIIVGFYFEACDVFDPHAVKGTPNASP